MKKNYETPILDVIEVTVENGFAATGIPADSEDNEGQPSNFKNGGW